MDAQLLRRLQLVELDIAKEIKRVCVENGIRYFLDSGSLLGAVRHRGFIPWDDDMDIGMLRPDYDRFLAIAPRSLKDDYFLQTWETDPYYPFPYAKVCKKGTRFVESDAQYSLARHEVFVDVFPYNWYAVGKWARAKTRFTARFYQKLLSIRCGYAPWSRQHGIERLWRWLRYRPYKWIADAFPKRAIMNRLQKAFDRYNGEPNEWYVMLSGALYGCWTAPASCLAEFVELPFEDDSFSCPADYDLFLKNGYGDYMTPPPENKRSGGHYVIEVKLD